VSSIIEKMWTTSPASLAKAVERRWRRVRPMAHEWRTVSAGPAKGVEMLVPASGGWGLDLVRGDFDSFLYDEIGRRHGPLAGAVCWDIGAHFGYHTLAFANQGARVLAFEPNIHNARRLKLHLERNPGIAGRVRIVEAAVSNADGEMVFKESADLEGESSGSHLVEATTPLEKANYARFAERTVKTVRMDSMIRNGETVPEIVKLDIEGAEFLALQGAEELMAARRTLFLMEVHHIVLMMKIQKLMAERGYDTEMLEAEATPSRCFVVASARRGSPAH
jgi:FkbM family methyltransferase